MRLATLSLFVFFLFAPLFALAESNDIELELADLDIDQLISLKVTSVSKKEQKITEAAAAIFVLTEEDIHRSGSTNIADLLRMVPGLHVGRIDSNKWGVSSRGFNGLFANKLLVLVDGRSVYTPLFSGVFWEVQDTVLEDIERIEVIRGPGATLWGANAVNGVINIITKSSEDTQDGLLTLGGGTEEVLFGSSRFGGKLSEDTSYRVFAKYNLRDNTKNSGFPLPGLDIGVGDSEDDWNVARGGFRIDSKPSDSKTFTLQGGAYFAEEGARFLGTSLLPPFSTVLEGEREANGTHLLGRFSHVLSEDSDYQIQAYYDRDDRDDFILEELRNTFDIDFQHRYRASSRHELVWGLGYRFYRDENKGSPTVFTDPAKRSVNLFTTFIQDEITLVENRLKLTLGSKFEHNQHTDFEFQPNARLLWTPDDTSSVWTAVSRAVRTPSRVHDDVVIEGAVVPTAAGLPGVITFLGDRTTEAEDLLAYELGYRAQLTKKLSFDIAAFYNEYTDLMNLTSGAPIPDFGRKTPVLVLPFTFNSEDEGETYGVELVIDWRPYDWWRLVGTYSYLKIDIHISDPASLPFDNTEEESPENQFSIRSLVDFPHEIEFDAFLRYVDRVPAFDIDSYFELDLRLAWEASDRLEFAVVGQNLLDSDHREFVSTFVTSENARIERGVYGQVTLGF